MIESINITAYYIVSGILYLCLALNSIVMINTIGGRLYKISKEKIKDIIIKLPALRSLITEPDKFVLKPAAYVLGFLLIFLSKIGTFLLGVDLFISKNDKTLPGEAVNYSALLLRKLHSENVPIMLSFALIGIVVFYFILTVL